MGLTTALQLAERGYKVTVLEKADNVAMVRNLFFKGLFENDVTPIRTIVYPLCHTLMP